MSQSLHVEIVPALSDNYIYLLHDQTSAETVVVDPGEAKPVLKKLNEKDWKLHYIWNTHHHWDHTGGNLALKQATGCQIVGSSLDQQRIPGIDILVEDGKALQWHAYEVSIIATPGHTLGAVCYWLREPGILFSGDTLFAMGCGRLFEGTPLQMWQSLSRLRQLPAETRLYCGHEYTLANGRFALSIDPDNDELKARLARVEEKRQKLLPSLPCTLGEEYATNPFLRPDNRKLRERLGMEAAEDWQVFHEIRKRKDVF